MANGTSFPFVASTLSGAPVTLTNTGPCEQAGLTLTIDSGSGSCTRTARSVDGPGYAATTQNYTVQAVRGQQTARLAAPPSGRFSVGRTIRLQNPAQGTTSADRNVTWRVTSGGKRCVLRFPASGAVNVKLRRAGQCTLVARAPGVPGQWLAFELRRTYTAR